VAYKGELIVVYLPALLISLDFFDFFDFDGIFNNTELLALRGGCVFVVGFLLWELCESE